MSSFEALSKIVPKLLFDVCEGMDVSICIADPDYWDTPIVYANSAFEKMTGWTKNEILGNNCRFLQGTLTDSTLTDELALACASEQAAASAVINYRRDGSAFFNLLAIKPIKVPGRSSLLLGCQYDYKPMTGMPPNASNAALIDAHWRKIRDGIGKSRNSFTDADAFRLDAVSMRFEAAFIRAQNAMVRKTTEITIAKLAEIAGQQSKAARLQQFPLSQNNSAN